jgi:hypothetical protein
LPPNFDDVVVAASAAQSGSQIPSLSEELFCPECGYDLRGSASDRCPECGLAIDRQSLSVSRIPWIHRAEIGAWRAYWRTVQFVVANPRQLALEVARPVSYRDAQMFRWTSIFVISLPPVAIAFLWWLSTNEYQGRGWDWYDTFRNVIPIEMGAWTFVLTALGALAYVTVLTGVASYFFHPGDLPMTRQNRAVALSYYPSAMLVAAAIGFDFGLVAMWLINTSQAGEAIPVVVATVLGFFALAAAIGLIGYLWRTVRLLGRATGCGLLRQLACGATIILWFLIGAPLLVIGVPAAVAWSILVIGA